MPSLEDLLGGRGRRMVLVVRVPSHSPPRLADFTILCMPGGSMLIKLYKAGEEGAVCEDLAGIEAELAFHGLLYSSLVELFICGMNFLERLVFIIRAKDVLAVRVRRKTCLYLRGLPHNVVDILSRASKCEARYSSAWVNSLEGDIRKKL